MPVRNQTASTCPGFGIWAAGLLCYFISHILFNCFYTSVSFQQYALNSLEVFAQEDVMLVINCIGVRKATVFQDDQG